MLHSPPLKERRAQLTYSPLSDLGQEACSALQRATLRLLARSSWVYPCDTVSTVPLRVHEEAVAVCEGHLDFLRLARAHQPAKSLRGHSWIRWLMLFAMQPNG